MGYDTSILNFVTLDLKFCFANSFDSCRMGGLALFTIQVFSRQIPESLLKVVL